MSKLEEIGTIIEAKNTKSAKNFMEQLGKLVIICNNAFEKVDSVFKSRFTRQNKKIFFSLRVEFVYFFEAFNKVITSLTSKNWADADDAFIEQQAHFVKQEHDSLVARFPKLF